MQCADSCERVNTGSLDGSYYFHLGVRVPGSVRDVYLAAKEGKGYFDVGGATLYFSNHKDGRQMISSSGPFKQPLEAVVCQLLNAKFIKRCFSIILS